MKAHEEKKQVAKSHFICFLDKRLIGLSIIFVRFYADDGNGAN